MFNASSRTTRTTCTSRTNLFSAFASSLFAIALICAMALSGCASDQATQTSSSSSSSDAVATQEEVQPLNITLTVDHGSGSNASPETYTVVLTPDHATVFEAIMASDMNASIEDGQFGKYITAIGDTTEGANRGWVYTINGEEVMESIDSYQLSDGDSVELEYVSF